MTRMIRTGRLVLVCAVIACASRPFATRAMAVTPPAPGAGAPQRVAAPAPVSLDRKVAWMLRLEQQRQLSDAATPPLPPRTTAGGALVLAPADAPSLLALAADPDAGVRRRAVLAIGRVGASDGTATLVASLKDPDEFVRQTAAFALGLLNAKDKEAATIPALEAALADTTPMVRGRAAEALGLLAHAASAPAVAAAASGCRAAFAGIEPDDESTKAPDVEACRLALFALVRLRAVDAILKIALDEGGQPASRWWPVAFALQRVRDAKAAPALLALAAGPGVYSQGFALKGLAALNDRRVVPIAMGLAANAAGDARIRIGAVQALARTAGVDATDPLVAIAADRNAPVNLQLAAVDALAVLKDRRAFDPLLLLTRDPRPAMRAAALSAAAAVDSEAFLLIVSSLPQDPDWSVRAALATTFAKLPLDRVVDALDDLAADPDARVQGPALQALADVHAPDVNTRALAALEAPDFVVRATAARLIGAAKPAGGADKLAAAFTRSATDATYTARVAILEALAKYGADAARVTLRHALADPEWPVRTRAAALLGSLGETDVMAISPAPLRYPAEFFESERLLHPKYSPHALVETRYGEIEIELNVIEAPVTTAAFIDLARAGFFNGLKVHRLVPNFVIQTGDPRGDGEGGPGYSIRDELSPLPYVRGTVGMALDFADTGGSQFFITVSPQPHLDGKYTVFGKVVKGGELLDVIAPWDVIERVTIWDGSV